MIKKLLATTIVAASTVAHAGHLSFSLGIGFYAPTPVYVQSTCVPVYTQSYYGPGPTVYGQTVYTSQGAYIPIYTEPAYVAPVPQVRYDYVPVYVTPAPHYECGPREFIHGSWHSNHHRH